MELRIVRSPKMRIPAAASKIGHYLERRAKKGNQDRTTHARAIIHACAKKAPAVLYCAMLCDASDRKKNATSYDFIQGDGLHALCSSDLPLDRSIETVNNSAQRRLT